eukprot:scaffold12656_cov133-Skeletonema_dohrnii-CCMP3373.AAC.2
MQLQAAVIALAFGRNRAADFFGSLTALLLTLESVPKHPSTYRRKISIQKVLLSQLEDKNL